MRRPSAQPGFTLSKLLVATVLVAGIGVSIYPTLQSATTQRVNSVVMDSVSHVSNAYQAYRNRYDAGGHTRMQDLVQFMGASQKDTVSEIDGYPNISSGQQTLSCSNKDVTCLRFSNGAVVLFPTQAAFGQTNENNALPFLVDPDGMVSSVKSVGFALYYSGQFRSGGTYLPDTVYYENGQEAKPHLNPNPQYDPHWFTWDQ